jgi:hypothetical protein
MELNACVLTSIIQTGLKKIMKYFYFSRFRNYINNIFKLISDIQRPMILVNLQKELAGKISRNVSRIVETVKCTYKTARLELQRNQYSIKDSKSTYV